jgi:hypothetical protein
MYLNLIFYIYVMLKVKDRPVSICVNYILLFKEPERVMLNMDYMQ